MSTQCLLIDFETINGITTTEGMAINTQYYSEYGVRFELENGQSPVIAQVGGIATAFGSIYGNDEPAPGQGIGKFFITDDGMLSGLSAIPLIVRFDNPLDSLSAVILDMDFNEIFTIEARDINEVPIFTKVIMAGDAGTGDGIATPFGFNLEGCEGAIYSLRFIGTRDTPGAFGLGMDNFILCFSGIDIEKNIDFNTIDENCNTLGSIIINNKSNINYEYSIDGINFISEQEFNNLPSGNYEISVRDEAGCKADFEIEVPIAESINIFSIDINPTTCDLRNGSVDIIATGLELQYSLDGINYSANSTLTKLAPGNFTAYVQDIYGCLDSIEGFIDPSFPLTINAINISPDTCENTVGTIEIIMPNQGNYTYKVNELPISNSNFFEDLPHGEYIIEIIDEKGCIVDTIINVGFTPAIFIDQISSTLTHCLDKDGTISFAYSGGTGTINLFLNQEQIINATSPIENLGNGDYTITLVDEFGCNIESLIKVEQEICPIYFGNVFTPNNDGNNDNFPIITFPDYDAGVLRYLVFDRWGNKIFDSRNFSIHDASYWWDGKSNGSDAVPGVYVFMVEILHPNGKTQILSGDITLLR